VPLYFYGQNVGNGSQNVAKGAAPSYFMLDVESLTDARARIYSPNKSYAGFLFDNSLRHYFLGVSTEDFGSQFDVVDNTADALRFTISSTGNVGIGAENPESLLHLYTSNVNGAGSRLIFGDDLLNGRTNAYIAEWGWQTNTDSDILELSGYNGIKFTTGSRSANTPMEITSSGDIVVTGKISGVTDPVDAQDAATKAYVDLLESKIEELEAMIGSEQGVVIDIDNNRYHIVTIGTQTWMAENLKVTRYNDGTPIPLVTDNVAWSNLSTPGYTWYNNSSSDYGALYNWYTVSNGIKNVCPTGWHIPTDDEWGNLVSFLGGSDNAMGKMKQSGLANWTMPNTAATNDSGFAGLPGGNR